MIKSKILLHEQLNRIVEISGKNPDIRKFNMGYNKNGILKVLDI